MVSVQVRALPEQTSPDHPPKTLPPCGSAESVTATPSATSAVQSGSFAPPFVITQVRPAAFAFTMPLPFPAPTTVSASVDRTNDAVTSRSSVTLGVQLPVPVHAPPQLTNVHPAAGVAVSVTVLPNPNGALHVPNAAPSVSVHAMPAGVEATAPNPLPVTATVGVMAENRAVTDCAALSVT